MRPSKLRLRPALTLVEVTIALAVAFLFSAMMLRVYNQQRDIQTARALALRHAEVLQAANQYVSANLSALSTLAASGPIVIPTGRTSAAGAQPAAPGGLTTIQGGGFLPSAFVDTNSYGQSSALVVRPGAAAGSLEGVVVATGGRQTPDYIMGLAMEFIGPNGGYVPIKPLNGATDQILGFKGSWTAPIANFSTGGAAITPGHLAAYITGSSGGQTVGDFLWRTDIGVPEANRMHTSIDMGKHDLNHVEQITGGPSPTANAAGELITARTATETAIHIANTIVPAINPLADPSLAGSPSEYQDSTGATYKNYIRPDGNTRLAKLDLSTVVDSTAWDPQGGNMSTLKNYPPGTRLIDALPNFVISYSYVASDNTIVPKPVCGNPAAPDSTKARIFAIPLSSMDYIAPSATTTTQLSYQSVPVVTNAQLAMNGTNQITLNLWTANINNVQSVNAATLVDAQGWASTVWAVDNGASWVFHTVRASGAYGSSPTLPDGSPNPSYNRAFAQQAPSDFYSGKYPSLSLVQTACYYGP